MAGDDVGQAVDRRTEVDFVVLKDGVRKSAKRARCAAEAAVPVSGKPATRLAKRTEAVRDILGEHQGSVTAQSLLLELTMVAQAYGFTIGLLYAQERARANDVRRDYEPAPRKASTTRARRWTQQDVRH
jgi:CHAD domain-containing protein